MSPSSGKCNEEETRREGAHGLQVLYFLFTTALQG
jgi:hypothetical protein